MKQKISKSIIRDLSEAASVVLINDSTTDAAWYPIVASISSGTVSNIYTSSTKLTFNPATGNFSATQFTSLSDKKLKENIQPIEDALYIINQLEGVEFDWKDSKNHSSGLIAQDVENILPFLVVETENKSINYNGIIGYLVNAINELHQEVNILKQKLEDK